MSELHTSYPRSEKGGIDSGMEEENIILEGSKVQKITGEFWTSKQRAGNSIHEISYRACFKSELPRYFIRKFKKPGMTLFDPFLGRGTTIVEGALNGISGVGMDINPLAVILTYPRLHVPKYDLIEQRLKKLDLESTQESDGIDLSMFYHPKTLGEITSLRNYLIEVTKSETEDDTDRWIRMVATNRLTGHSKGFFSVYTLPPNQAASAERQKIINSKLGNTPVYRNVREIILRKTRSLLSDLSDAKRRTLNRTGMQSKLIAADSRIASSYIGEGSIDLTVTSPPFLSVVHYAEDNWLRCWFNNIEVGDVEQKVFVSGNLEEWKKFILSVLKQIHIITKKEGHVAFEVGEIKVHNSMVNLDEVVASLALSAGFDIEKIMINKQDFTKTSHIWGVKNRSMGTNTNRIVLMSKH